MRKRRLKSSVGIVALLFLMIIGVFLPVNRVYGQADTLTLLQPDSILWLKAKPLAPFSEKIFWNDVLLLTSEYEINYRSGKVRFFSPKKGVFRANYRVLRRYLADSVALRSLVTPKADTVVAPNDASFLPDSGAGVGFKRPGLAERSRLESRGGLSRAITLGTNRNLAVNSDFRLQLEGLVGGDVEVLAAITDENLPVQPDGSTQQITDFDRVFIRLKKKNWAITLGDYELKQTDTRYGDFYRNVLGGVLSYDDGKRRKISVAASISKGKFSTNSFTGENNKQGPYRLTGKNNEKFIILLAGSEKIYLNGQLAKRGEDYTVDYNVGEITFTARRPITNNTRIVVDFEYAERNYSRSFIFARYADSFLKDKLRFAASYGREADDPDSPLDLSIGARERDALRLAGDDPTKAVVYGADSTRFDASELRYAKRDSVFGGKTYKDVFIFSKDSTKAHYKVLFSYVGPNGGDYVLAPALFNGNVYQWKAPDSLGRSTGDYRPARLVPPPRLLQAFNFITEFDLAPRVRLYNETALSIDDANRLSSLDDADNFAAATRSGVRLTRLKLAKDLKLNGDANFRTVGARYQNFDRVYQMEYGREWNYNDQGRRLNETVGETTLEILYRETARLKLGGGARQMGDSLFTIKSTVEIQSDDTARLQTLNTLAYLATYDHKRKSRSLWLRNNGDVFKYLKKIRFGSEIWYERKRETSDTAVYMNGSFDFIDVKPYIRRQDIGLFDFDATFNYRRDNEYYAAAYRFKSETYIAKLQTGWRPVPTLAFKNTLSYQKFALRDTAFNELGLNTQESILGNLQFDYQMRNRLFQTAFLYQALTERIARRNSVYLQVNPGMGQYQWNDYNADGVQQLNEFEISSNPLTANFVRLLLPTLQLYPAVSLDFSFTIRTDFQRLFKDATSGWGKFFKYFGTLSALQLQQKRDSPLSAPRLKEYLIAFDAISDKDSSLLSASRVIKQEFFFFKNRPKGDFTLAFTDGQSRQFLVSGIELRRQTTYLARLRLNFGTKFSLEAPINYGNKINRAELLTSRNYALRFINAPLIFSVQLSRKTRLSSGYDFQWKENRLENGELNASLRRHKWTGEGKFNFSGRNNLTLKVELFRIELSGRPNSAANYELLEGMQDGNNAVFTVLWTQYLTKALELTVVYDGRAAQNRAFLHSGRMQLRALF